MGEAKAGEAETPLDTSSWVLVWFFIEHQVLVTDQEKAVYPLHVGLS